MVVIGGAIGVIMDSPVTDSSSSVDLVIRTTGVGTPLGAGAFLTRLTTAIILMDIILRIGTIMIPIAPYQESDSLGPDPSGIHAYERAYGSTENALLASRCENNSNESNRRFGVSRITLTALKKIARKMFESAINSNGQTIGIAGAHRDDGFTASRRSRIAGPQLIQIGTTGEST